MCVMLSLVFQRFMVPLLQSPVACLAEGAAKSYFASSSRIVPNADFRQERRQSCMLGFSFGSHLRCPNRCVCEQIIPACRVTGDIEIRTMPLVTAADLPYRSKFGNDRVDSTPRRWAGALVQYNEWHSSEKKAWADLSCDQVNLVVILGRHGGTCGPRFSLEKPMLADRNDPGFFFWIPANLTVYGFSEEARMIRELQVRFDAERLMPILGDEIFGGKLHAPTPSIYDDRVAKCASMLADCCINRQDEDQLFGECLITSLLAAAVQNITGRVSGRQVSGLVPWQLRIAKEYFHEHLVGEVSLEEVASLTKLSLSRFARGFKASTGLPPYKWLLKERIRRAQALMSATATPIADIATIVGFADQSHFTKAFRRTTGTTPRYWRADRQH